MPADGQSTALTRPAISAGGNVVAIVAHSFDDAFRIANALAASGITPFKRAEECLAVIMAGAELGLTPFAATQSFAVINGRVSIWGDGMMAVVRARGVRVQEKLEGQGDAMIATCTVTRPDDPEAVTRSFSMADARRANLAGKSGPWTQYPQRMLQMRARAWAIRDACADMLRGMKMAEEMQDVGVVDSVVIDRASDHDQRSGEERRAPSPARLVGKAARDLSDVFARRMSESEDEEALDVIWDQVSASELPRSKRDGLADHFEAVRLAHCEGTPIPPPPLFTEPAAPSPFEALSTQALAVDDAASLKAFNAALKAGLGLCAADERGKLQVMHAAAKQRVKQNESAGAGGAHEDAGSVKTDGAANSAGAEAPPASSVFEALKEQGLAVLQIEKPLARKAALQDWAGKLSGGAFNRLTEAERKELETLKENIGQEVGA